MRNTDVMVNSGDRDGRPRTVDGYTWRQGGRWLALLRHSSSAAVPRPNAMPAARATATAVDGLVSSSLQCTIHITRPQKGV